MRGPPPPAIDLTPRQRALLERLVRQATCPQRTVQRARILLACAEGLSNQHEDVPILVETTQAPFIIFDTENIPIFPYLKQRKEPEMKKLAPHDSSVKPLDAVPAEEIDALDTRIALIQALIPLGLDAVSALLQEEVTCKAPG